MTDLKNQARAVAFAKETLAGHPHGSEASSDLVLLWLANRAELHARDVVRIAKEKDRSGEDETSLRSGFIAGFEQAKHNSSLTAEQFFEEWAHAGFPIHSSIESTS